MSGNYFEDARTDLQGVARMIIDAVRLEIQAQANKGEANNGWAEHRDTNGGQTYSDRAIAVVREHRIRAKDTFTVPGFGGGYSAALDAIEGDLRDKLK